jgi:hypothetical protein
MTSVATLRPFLLLDGLLTVSAKVEAGYHDLLMAGPNEGLSLSDGLPKGFAAHDGSGLRDDAIGRMSVAALLDLQEGPVLTLEPDQGRQGLRSICVLGLDLEAGVWSNEAIWG